jgi:F-box/leucine-rich repeat protein 4
LNVSSCCNLNVDDVCVALSAYNKNLISLDLWRTTNLTSRGVFILAKGLPLLEELDLGWCLGVNAQSGCIVALAKGCPKLVKASQTH